MNIALIITTPDFAGLNIQKQLLALHPFKETGERFEDKPVYEGKTSLHTLRMYTTDTRCTQCEGFDKKIEADLFVFPTTHRSVAGVHSFTVHAIGNWGRADLGGNEKTLGIAPACLLKYTFLALKEQAQGLQYEVVMESTHHGPFLEKPCMFIEIGSNEESWQDEKAGEVIAKTLLKVFSASVPACKIAFAIGGPHYAPNFIKILEETDIAIGHICPKHHLEHLDAAMLQQVLDKTVEKVDLALLDWKGLGEHKQRIVALLDGAGLPYRKTKDF